MTRNTFLCIPKFLSFTFNLQVNQYAIAVNYLLLSAIDYPQETANIKGHLENY